jgi:hypothetical protein
MPYTILPADYRVSTRPLRTQHIRGPIPGNGLFTYKSFIMTYKDEVIFRSRGLSPHLFHPREDVLVLPSDVYGGGGTDGGFWVATKSHGVWWWTGEPGDWKNEQKDHRKYAQGALVIDGSFIPSLETTGLVVLFVSEDGLMVGLSNGRLVPLMLKRLRLDVTNKSASFIVQETGWIKQVLFSLE